MLQRKKAKNAPAKKKPKRRTRTRKKSAGERILATKSSFHQTSTVIRIYQIGRDFRFNAAIFAENFDLQNAVISSPEARISWRMTAKQADDLVEQLGEILGYEIGGRKGLSSDVIWAFDSDRRRVSLSYSEFGPGVHDLQSRIYITISRLAARKIFIALADKLDWTLTG